MAAGGPPLSHQPPPSGLGLTYGPELASGPAYGPEPAANEVGERAELCAGDRVAGRKQRHVMAEPNELFGEVGNDPFGSAVSSGRPRTSIPVRGVSVSGFLPEPATCMF